MQNSQRNYLNTLHNLIPGDWNSKEFKFKNGQTGLKNRQNNETSYQKAFELTQTELVGQTQGAFMIGPGLYASNYLEELD